MPQRSHFSMRQTICLPNQSGRVCTSELLSRDIFKYYPISVILINCLKHLIISKEETSVFLSVSRSSLPQLGSSTAAPPSGFLGPSFQLEQPGRRTALLLFLPLHESSLHTHLCKAFLWLRFRGAGRGGRRKPSHQRSSCLLVASPPPPPCSPR